MATSRKPGTKPVKATPYRNAQGQFAKRPTRSNAKPAAKAKTTSAKPKKAPTRSSAKPATKIKSSGAKTTTKRAPTRSAAKKAAPAKRATTAKKTTAKRTPVKKSPAQKAAVKKPGSSSKPSTKKATPKKAPAKKANTVKRTPAKKAAASRSAASKSKAQSSSANRKNAPRENQKTNSKKARSSSKKIKDRLPAKDVPRSSSFKVSTITNEGNLVAHLELISQRAKYPKAFYQKVVAEFANMEAERFANFGPAPSYGITGKWAPLSVNTYGATKTGTSSRKNLKRGPLIRYGHLQYAATHPVIEYSGEMGIEISISPMQAKPPSVSSYGNDTDYAGYHQTGTSRMPKREIIPKITPTTIFGKYIGVIAKNYFLPSQEQEALPSEKGISVQNNPQVSSETKQEIKRIKARDAQRAERKAEKEARSKAYQKRLVKARQKEAKRLEASAKRKAERAAKRLETMQRQGRASITKEQHQSGFLNRAPRIRQTDQERLDENMQFAEERARFAEYMAMRKPEFSKQEHLAFINNIYKNDVAYRNARQSYKPSDFIPKGGTATMAEYFSYRSAAPGYFRSRFHI